MKYRYVVIEREYGSGGTETGHILSEITGVPCYGAEIQQETAEALNIPVSEIEKYEESVTNSLLYSLYAMSKLNGGSDDILSKEDKIFVEQQQIIRGHAMQGPSIFVGRCAGAAIKAYDGVLSVFIRADKESRIERAVREYGIDQASAAYIMARYDKKRRSYYAANTGRKWSDPDNYHIVLDSGKLGIKTCAEIIKSAFTG